MMSRMRHGSVSCPKYISCLCRTQASCHTSQALSRHAKFCDLPSLATARCCTSTDGVSQCSVPRKCAIASCIASTQHLRATDSHAPPSFYQVKAVTAARNAIRFSCAPRLRRAKKAWQLLLIVIACLRSHNSSQHTRQLLDLSTTSARSSRSWDNDSMQLK